MKVSVLFRSFTPKQRAAWLKFFGKKGKVDALAVKIWTNCNTGKKGKK